MDNYQSLDRAYREAVYEIDLTSGRRRFRIGDAIPPVRGRTFALLTAYNPGRVRPGEEENRRANERLERRLVALGVEYVEARGMSADGHHVEPSFALFGLDREHAVELAREFGQAAIVWFDGETAELAWRAEAPPRAAT
ncbi:MAG: DUF3293 domain-containing protein [Dehalococcoidia bacterium]|jgi:hypothetical protein